jgi:hypothetical protein
MASAPAVLAAYAGIRQAFEERGTLDLPTRTATMLITSTADACRYSQGRQHRFGPPRPLGR